MDGKRKFFYDTWHMLSVLSSFEAGKLVDVCGLKRSSAVSRHMLAAKNAAPFVYEIAELPLLAPPGGCTAATTSTSFDYSTSAPNSLLHNIPRSLIAAETSIGRCPLRPPTKQRLREMKQFCAGSPSAYQSAVVPSIVQ